MSAATQSMLRRELGEVQANYMVGRQLSAKALGSLKAYA